MLQLRQLDLELAFPSASALGEDIEDEGRPIQDLAVEDFLQVAALGGSQFIIKNDRVDVGPVAEFGEFIGFAFADESAGAGSSQLLKTIADDLGSGCHSQFGKFVQ